VDRAKFALSGFSHASTRFALTGKHEALACAVCHKSEQGVFPSGKGTATRLTGISGECRACHADVHLGQLADSCETCHTTHSFRVAAYRHRNRELSAFFSGRHLLASCDACHKVSTAQFPAGSGTAIRFQADTRCVACHSDVHRGALGNACITCHRP
jgi:hypothetical protein